MNKEKKPKSPVLVWACIAFLAMFIVMPPYFRFLYPKEEEIPVEEVSSEMLSCERINVTEKIKTTSDILYEDGVPIENTITYVVYEPTADDIANAANNPIVGSFQEEVAYFKTMSEISIEESENQTVVYVEQSILEAYPEDERLANYFLDIDEATTNMEQYAFVCYREDY